MQQSVVNQLWRFLLAGAFGFVVELLVVGLLTTHGWAALSARAVSFPLASLLTWLLNRHFAFREARACTWPDMLREYRRYFSGQLVGALTNLAVFTLLVISVPTVGALMALTVGALFGLVVNYYLARKWAFRGRHDDD